MSDEARDPETTNPADEPLPGDHLFERPVPNVGDDSSVNERDRDVSGWAFDQATQAALDRVIGARRDIRRFRPDPVSDELVREVLNAGHGGPSVGQSQPWRFIIVKDRRTRERAALMSDRERMRQSRQLTAERSQRLLDLQLEGIREAPLGIVVACDRRAPAAGVLGRNTFHDADMWSCAAAIENMWLTARALGLGMGWVTLMQPDELAGLLNLPEGVTTLGWLCLGWPNERPPYPGLERRAWSHKLPLDQVVMTDRWPDNGPEPPVSALAGMATAEPVESLITRPIPDDPSSVLWSDVHAPSPQQVVDARDKGEKLLTPPGSLGKLDQALDRLVAASGDQVTGGTLVLVGADHPLNAHKVSAFDQSVSRQVMEAALEGRAVGVVTARSAGLDVMVVDAGIDGGPVAGCELARPEDVRGDLVNTPAMTTADVRRLVTRGRELGARAAQRGVVCLGEIGIGNTTIASALACVFTGITPEQAAGIGAGSDAKMVEHKAEVLRAIFARTDITALRADPALALAEVGGPEFAVLAGVILGAVEAGSTVVLDGLAGSVPALAVVEVNPAVQSYLIAGQVSREFAHGAVLTRLGLEPLVSLRLRAGEGVGACLATQMLFTGLAVRRQSGRTEE
ncbi:5,6-dimethylbenzimidazole synthase [Propionibacterium freudenreichii]|uniref:5,6-dimethylbenzimidazole synthase n=1 Tax=Propionibacterium freudenreichii TaxID=1744 RepID=UPI000542016E|nr:5,6-dimethylbenzimidazole synthase [Propionibacterium freudenreichii]CEH07121.1 Phosphoribosyltransferase/nitroreductase (fusion gene) (Nicotinate-nucleotide-dimethylbenzimidazole phosphoribosyltransferase) [Propionibacterium freudenreichii]